MRRLDRCIVAGIASLALTQAASADPWDLAAKNDDGPTTASELIHGSDEQHDLGATDGTADEDWFRVSLRAYSSYEVVVDGTGGDIANVIVERIGTDGTTVLQTAFAIGAGHARSLRFQNNTARPASQFIRVRSGSCTSDCDADDVYRLRQYETTYAIPRFNNTGTQVTVLLLQNPTDYTITGTTRFWDASGASVGTSPFTLAPRAELVLQTQIIAPAISGSMTISHSGRYGDLAGKAVSLEPATGFSFDTPIVPRIH
jgi:hypothetical protein